LEKKGAREEEQKNLLAQSEKPKEEEHRPAMEQATGGSYSQAIFYGAPVSSAWTGA